MNVLSLDIDFFVSPTAYYKSLGSSERLPEGRYKVDSEEDVRRFLETNCCLSSTEKVPGQFIVNHDEAFDILKDLEEPPHLTHVDAHVDLGMGDRGFVYLLGEWLHGSYPLPTPKPGPDGMNLSNWLAFAAAAGLVTGVDFVPREIDSNSEVFSFYQSSNANELAFYDLSPIALEDYVWTRRSFTDFTSHPVKASVPWRQTDRSVFQLEAAPDFVIVCQSPQFTPEAADRLFDDVLREYVMG